MTSPQKLVLPTILASLLMIGSSLAQATLTPELKITAEGVIGGQINAFKSRDHEKAFGYAAPGIRKVFGSTDRFIGMVKNGYGAIYGARNWDFGRGEFLNDMLIQEVLLVGPQGRNWVALYTLRKQADGSWKITAVQMKQGKAQST